MKGTFGLNQNVVEEVRSPDRSNPFWVTLVFYQHMKLHYLTNEPMHFERRQELKKKQKETKKQVYICYLTSNQPP